MSCNVNTIVQCEKTFDNTFDEDLANIAIVEFSGSPALIYQHQPIPNIFSRVLVFFFPDHYT